MADTHVETSDLNQDSLDGAQASVSEVGSAEEFEKENTEDTPSGSHGEADGNQKEGEAVDGTNGEESREAEDAAVPADATAAAVVTENGAVESEPHVNGNGKCDENTEADSTEVDGSAAEKRKSVVETEALSISPKKARVEGTDEDVIGTEEAALPTNGNHETVA
ncbi:uncharacterized protein LOC116918018 isoform X2 [Daphnia magna]|uniref:uncharacterized protein LOC116918018 isoform X2 n=1 Tax=Daphnia magna TaxID=35525 RepID=UPI001402BDF1|nr:uncharacterized protein LOC116918018 isoform X2 [Daphnia magna]